MKFLPAIRAAINRLTPFEDEERLHYEDLRLALSGMINTTNPRRVDASCAQRRTIGAPYASMPTDAPAAQIRRIAFDLLALADERDTP